MNDPFQNWLAAAETRYLANLTRAELGRALRALSSCYVERRGRLAEGAPLATAGKRAAFALFYGPLHFLTVRAVAEALRGAAHGPTDLRTHGATDIRPTVDLGCGTGAAGAAWALARGGLVRGYDVNPWAVNEAEWTYRTLGVSGTAARLPVEKVRLATTPSTILAGYVVNELPAPARDALLPRLLAAAKAHCEVVVIEPISRTLTPWWREWQKEFEAAGGRFDEWRFRVELPPLLRDLDRSAGLDHRELTAKSMAVGEGVRPGRS